MHLALHLLLSPCMKQNGNDQQRVRQRDQDHQLWYAHGFPFFSAEAPSYILLTGAVDGGGPGVLSELFILKELLYRLQNALNLDYLPLPCHFVDLVAGCGLGG